MGIDRAMTAVHLCSGVTRKITAGKAWPRRRIDTEAERGIAASSSTRPPARRTHTNRTTQRQTWDTPHPRPQGTVALSGRGKRNRRAREEARATIGKTQTKVGTGGSLHRLPTSNRRGISTSSRHTHISSQVCTPTTDVVAGGGGLPGNHPRDGGTMSLPLPWRRPWTWRKQWAPTQVAAGEVPVRRLQHRSGSGQIAASATAVRFGALGARSAVGGAWRALIPAVRWPRLRAARHRVRRHARTGRDAARPTPNTSWSTHTSKERRPRRALGREGTLVCLL